MVIAASTLKFLWKVAPLQPVRVKSQSNPVFQLKGKNPWGALPHLTVIEAGAVLHDIGVVSLLVMLKLFTLTCSPMLFTSLNLTSAGELTKAKLAHLTSKLPVKILEHKEDYCILEAIVDEHQTKELLELLEGIGIKELARTGRIAIEP